MPNRRQEDRSPTFSYRAVRAFRDHPRISWGTLAAIGAVLAHERHDATVEAYGSVKIDALRVERLGDEVDQLTLKRSVVGKLAPLESAQLELWQKKLNNAAAALVADQKTAKDTTKEETQ